MDVRFSTAHPGYFYDARLLPPFDDKTGDVNICETANYYYLCNYEKNLGIYKEPGTVGEEVYLARVYKSACGVIYAVVYSQVEL